MEFHATIIPGMLSTLKATEAAYQNPGSGTGLGDQKQVFNEGQKGKLGWCWRLHVIIVHFMPGTVLRS